MGDTPQLHDIHLPGSASFWPPALGWWLLLAILFFLTIWLFLKNQKRKKIQQKKKLVLKKLDVLIDNIKKNATNESVAEVNTLLRQLALNTYPRADIASLTGVDWLKFLDVSGNTKEFTRGAGRVLIEAPYQANDLRNFNQDEFLSLIKKWVTKSAKKWGGVS